MDIETGTSNERLFTADQAWLVKTGDLFREEAVETAVGQTYALDTGIFELEAAAQEGLDALIGRRRG